MVNDVVLSKEDIIKLIAKTYHVTPSAVTLEMDLVAGQMEPVVYVHYEDFDM